MQVTKRVLLAVALVLGLAGVAAAQETAIKPGASTAAVGKGVSADGAADQDVLRSTLTFFVQ